METYGPTKVVIESRYGWQKVKVSFRCGKCGLANLCRPDLVEDPPVICKYCNAINILPIIPED
jgi:DNA-directed RNA polymerase subunit RPC12/RpoP